MPACVGTTGSALLGIFVIVSMKLSNSSEVSVARCTDLPLWSAVHTVGVGLLIASGT